MSATTEPYVTMLFSRGRVTERISAALRRAYADQRHAAKRLARATGRDPRAVQGWIYGDTAPPAAALIDLAAECDELADEILKMIAERKAACAPR